MAQMMEEAFTKALTKAKLDPEPDETEADPLG